MDTVPFQNLLLFEHRFWLQILGDHSRFIMNALSPEETVEVSRARRFITVFDSLLYQSRQEVTGTHLSLLTQQAQYFAYEIRNFKLHLLGRHLTGKIKINMSPTFLNHMLNELEEYIRILCTFISGQIPLNNPVHYHLLWLSDAVGHAANVAGSVDEVERKTIEKSKEFEKDFVYLHEKAEEIAAYMRTGLESFPALSCLNCQAEKTMTPFKEFLEELLERKLGDRLLGSMMPLIADHMAREECYYLTKLSQVSDIKPPGCDPAKPRVGQGTVHEKMA